LIGECEFGGLFLQFCEFVLVLGDLFEGGLDELALHVTDGDGELVDLEVSEDDFTLEEEHLSLKTVPLVEVLLADLLQVVFGGGVQVSCPASGLKLIDFILFCYFIICTTQITLFYTTS
jgi:hypothetical protein